MPEIKLDGCTPEPLMSYLKALGTFRLIAEQADSNAKLAWRGGVAYLTSTLDQSGLLGFFSDQYKPTPITAPWNGGSGFYGSGDEPLETILTSTSERLALYRATIKCIRTFIPKTKPKDGDKDLLLVQCRSELADAVVPWLDVCFVLSERRTSFFALLGTGGNDGRLDFTNNFMQRLAEMISLDGAQATEHSRAFLSSALFADTLLSLGKTAIGQFNPGGIGGANGTQGKFEADSKVNPWDFILMIEGVLLFAGALSRRMGNTNSSRSVFPFLVDSVAVGYGSSAASEETTDGSRAELWLPLWTEPTTYAEIKHLMSEGRAQLGRQQARNAVEFALAVNLLGVDRGITSFSRFGFLKRNGLAFLAAPLGQVKVTLRPNARLLDDPPLCNWVDRLRRACNDKEKTPARYQTALRGIDHAMFAFANRSESGNDADTRYLLDVLCAIGQAERTLSKGLSFAAGKYIRPLSGLCPDWLTQATDRSLEFRLAASLAGIRAKGEVGPIRTYLEQIEDAKFPKWEPGSTSAVWSQQSLARNLADVFSRRQLEGFRAGIAGVPNASHTCARLDDVIAFLNRQTNDEKIADLLWGLMCVDAPNRLVCFEPSEQRVPFVFGLPRLLVNSHCFVKNNAHWNLGHAEVNAKADPDVFQQLRAGRADAVSQCVTRAARRLKSGGLLVAGYRNKRHSGQRFDIASRFDATRLLASMLFPLSDHELERIANSVLYPVESEASHVD
jgi:CRISPR-associated protein Csx17